MAEIWEVTEPEAATFVQFYFQIFLMQSLSFTTVTNILPYNKM